MTLLGHRVHGFALSLSPFIFFFFFFFFSFLFLFLFLFFFFFFFIFFFFFFSFSFSLSLLSSSSSSSSSCLSISLSLFLLLLLLRFYLLLPTASLACAWYLRSWTMLKYVETTQVIHKYITPSILQLTLCRNFQCSFLLSVSSAFFFRSPWHLQGSVASRSFFALSSPWNDVQFAESALQNHYISLALELLS